MQATGLAEAQKLELEKKISDAEEQNEKIQTVGQSPGVGKITACAFVASAGEAGRFERASKLSSCLGFVPRIDCSSGAARCGRVTKKGNACLRGLLVQAAWPRIRSKSGGRLKEKHRSLVARGAGRKKAAVAVARKMAELMYALLKRGGVYEVRSFAPRPPKAEALAAAALAAAS